tara:strand:- start:1648 stop:1941 length:294 start_codon:yes stop_codon:yes gene_type:complete
MFTTTIVLIILYFVFKWSVAWINYFNQLDKRFGISIWRYSYDYKVEGNRDISFLDDREFVLLRRKRNRAVTFMYFVFFISFIVFMSFMNQLLLKILN